MVVVLFLIAGFIATWLFEHSKYQAPTDRAFIPLQAIFICFMAILLVMAFQRCFWIGLTKRTVLDEAVEMGWLFERLNLSESDWRAYILNKHLTVFVAERPLPEPAASQIKAACFYFFKIMFGYSKLSFWTAVAQKRACFPGWQVEPIIAEITAAYPPAEDEGDHLTEEERQVLLDLRGREQALLRQVAEQAEIINQSTVKNDDALITNEAVVTEALHKGAREAMKKAYSRRSADGFLGRWPNGRNPPRKAGSDAFGKIASLCRLTQQS